MDTENSIPWHGQHIPAHGHTGPGNSASPATQILLVKQWHFLNYSSAEGGNTWFPQFWGKERIPAFMLVFLGFFFFILQLIGAPGTSQPRPSPAARRWQRQAGNSQFSASPGCSSSKEIINRAEGGAQGGYRLSHPHSRWEKHSFKGIKLIPAIARAGSRGREGRISDYYSHQSTSNPFPGVFGILSHTFIFTHSCPALGLIPPSCKGFIHKPLEWEGKKKSRSSSEAAQTWNCCWKHQECSPARRHSQRGLISWTGLFSRLVLANPLIQKPHSIMFFVWFFVFFFPKSPNKYAAGAWSR